MISTEKIKGNSGNQLLYGVPSEKRGTKVQQIVNLTLERFESAYHPRSKRLVRKWSISSGEIHLFVDPVTNRFSAEVKNDNKIYKVSKEDIIGLPYKGQDDSNLLEKYFKDASARITTLQGKGYKIYISHGLKGGMFPAEQQGFRKSSCTASLIYIHLIRRFQTIVRDTKEHLKANSNVGPVVAVIGETGSGRSTAINHLSGSRVEVIREEGPLRGKIRVVEGDEEITKIGHSFTFLGTSVAKICHRANSRFTFIDCGGFLDIDARPQLTDVPIVDIDVITSLKLTLQNQTNLRVMICIEYNTLGMGRGGQFAKKLKAFLEDFLKWNHRTSVMVVLTKPPYLADEDPPRYANTEDGRRIILNMLHETMEGGLCNLLSFIMEKQHIAVYNPRREESREEILDKLGKIDVILDPKKAFSLAYSSNTRDHLNKEIELISNHGLHLLRQLNQIKDAVLTLRDKETPEKLAEANVEHERIIQEIRSLKDYFESLFSYLELSGDNEQLRQALEGKRHEFLLDEPAPSPASSSSGP